MRSMTLGRLTLACDSPGGGPPGELAIASIPIVRSDGEVAIRVVLMGFAVVAVWLPQKPVVHREAHE